MLGKRSAKVAVLAGVIGSLASCVVEQTVTGEDGEVIYQKPVVDNPFASEATKMDQVDKREAELGF